MTKEITIVSDIHSIYGYTVFANIDDRNGTINGHRMILDEETMGQIEDIILSKKILVEENSSYEMKS